MYSSAIAVITPCNKTPSNSVVYSRIYFSSSSFCTLVTMWCCQWAEPASSPQVEFRSVSFISLFLGQSQPRAYCSQGEWHIFEQLVEDETSCQIRSQKVFVKHKKIKIIKENTKELLMEESFTCSPGPGKKSDDKLRCEEGKRDRVSVRGEQPLCLLRRESSPPYSYLLYSFFPLPRPWP